MAASPSDAAGIAIAVAAADLEGCANPYCTETAKPKLNPFCSIGCGQFYWYNQSLLLRAQEDGQLDQSGGAFVRQGGSGGSGNSHDHSCDRACGRSRSRSHDADMTSAAAAAAAAATAPEVAPAAAPAAALAESRVQSAAAAAPSAPDGDDADVEEVLTLPWELILCRCDPQGPTMRQLVPGEQVLRCFECLESRGRSSAPHHFTRATFHDNDMQIIPPTPCANSVTAQRTK